MTTNALAPGATSTGHKHHTLAGKLGPTAIVFMVVAAAAPLTVVAGTVPHRHRRRKRRRVSRVVRRVHGGAAAVRRRLHRDGQAHPRCRCLLHLHRTRLRPAHRARRRVPGPAVLHRRAGRGVRLHRRGDQRPDHLARRAVGALVPVCAGDDGRRRHAGLPPHRPVRQGPRRPADLRGRHRHGHQRRRRSVTEAARRACPPPRYTPATSSPAPPASR